MRVLVLGAMCLLHAATASFAQPAEPDLRALAVQYADGRINHQLLLGSSGAGWFVAIVRTPPFPMNPLCPLCPWW